MKTTLLSGLPLSTTPVLVPAAPIDVFAPRVKSVLSDAEQGVVARRLRAWSDARQAAGTQAIDNGFDVSAQAARLRFAVPTVAMTGVPPRGRPV